MEIVKAKSIITNIWVHNKISEKTKNTLFKILELHKDGEISLNEIKKEISFSEGDKIQSIEEFVDEFNNFKKHIELAETSGETILNGLDNNAKKELESMSLSIKKHPQKFSEISNVLKNIINNIPQGYDTKKFNLYVANKIVHRYRVKDMDNKHHIGIFCEELFDKKIETEEFKKNFDILYTKIGDLKKDHFMDLFHFFAGYSAYNTWLGKPEEATKLKVFKFFYTSITGIFTNAEKNNKGIDLPPELRRAYRYTLGGDTISDIAYVNTVLDAHQILVDIYGLMCLKNSLQENDFDIQKAMNHFLDMVKNKADYKNNEFYDVTKEMFDLEIKKRRMSIIKVLSKLGQSLTGLLPILNLFIANFEKMINGTGEIKLKVR